MSSVSFYCHALLIKIGLLFLHEQTIHSKSRRTFLSPSHLTPSPAHPASEDSKSSSLAESQARQNIPSPHLSSSASSPALATSRYPVTYTSIYITASSSGPALALVLLASSVFSGSAYPPYPMLFICTSLVYLILSSFVLHIDFYHPSLSVKVSRFEHCPHGDLLRRQKSFTRPYFASRHTVT